MVRIVTIVEGHGECVAVPVLIRRIAQVVEPSLDPDLPKPIRVNRQRLLKHRELERTVELAARQTGTDGSILILLDADDDCPRDLAPQVLTRARAVREDRRISVVLAKREFESWFLAAASSIAGHRGIRADAAPPANPEEIRNPKKWLSDQMGPGRSYRETLDQAALAARFDLTAGRSAPSFDKMWRELAAALRRSG